MEGSGPVIAFWMLAAVTLVAAGGVLVSRNLLHAVLFLILAFIGVAGHFVLLSAEFLAMAQVIIYVGAISVLVLFAILLTPRASRDNGETKAFPFGALLAIALAAVFLFVINDYDWRTVAESPRIAPEALVETLLTS